MLVPCSRYTDSDEYFALLASLPARSWLVLSRGAVHRLPQSMSGWSTVSQPWWPLFAHPPSVRREPYARGGHLAHSTHVHCLPKLFYHAHTERHTPRLSFPFSKMGSAVLVPKWGRIRLVTFALALPCPLAPFPFLTCSLEPKRKVLSRSAGEYKLGNTDSVRLQGMSVDEAPLRYGMRVWLYICMYVWGMYVRILLVCVRT